MLKHCHRCDVKKPGTEFHRNKNNPDGLASQCKACRTDVFRARPKYVAEPCASRACVRCKIEKPTSEFHRSGTNKTGLHSYCKACQRLYYVEQGGYEANKERFRRYRVAKAEYVRRKKVEAGCADCGDRREPVLEYHHRDPSTKTATVNNLTFRQVALEVLEAEMEKCEVLCSNCHRMRHWRERQAKKKKSA